MTLFYYNNMPFELNKRVFYVLSFFTSVQFSCSVVSDFATPWTTARQGLPAHHQLLEFTQTHVHWVGNAIQPSHPLLSPSFPPSIFPSIRVLSNESVLHIRWPKYWSFRYSISPSNEYSGLSHRNSVCNIIDYRYAQYIAHIVMVSFNEHLLNDCYVLRVKKTKSLSSWNLYSSKRSQITQTNK